MTNFTLFYDAMVTEIAMGVGMPKEIITKLFNASFSASRAAMLEMWKFVQIERQALASGFCHPVYVRWLDDMVATGRISAPGYFENFERRKAFQNALWIGDAFTEIDPVKPAQAALIWNKLGVKSLDRINRETTGGSFEGEHKQLKHEFDKRTEDGLIAALEQESSEADVTPDEVVDTAPSAQAQADAVIEMTDEELFEFLSKHDLSELLDDESNVNRDRSEEPATTGSN